MKVARLIAAPLVFTVYLSQACSDPPSPPVQGAVTLKISPTSGQTCQHTNGQLSAPSAQNAGVYGELLGCDLTQGCKPDEFVVVDRDRNTDISCSITANGSNFNVNILMNVSSSPSMQFGVTGTVTPQGGTVSISESNSVALGGGTDNACQVTITPNRGTVGKGKIWATFLCTMFRDQNNLGDTGCTVEGAFLFENCSG
jgi:hypothetical protein